MGYDDFRRDRKPESKGEFPRFVQGGKENRRDPRGNREGRRDERENRRDEPKRFGRTPHSEAPAPRPQENRDEETVRSGPHAVTAILEERPAQINRIIFLLNSGNPRLHELQRKAEGLRIPCQQLPEEKLRRYARHHQGVIALCHARPLDEWETVKERLIGLETGLAVVLAGIEDPHNLGACARSSLALGAAALLLPARGGCGLTETALRASAGALERMTVCRPPVLDRAIDELRQAGWRVVRLWEGATAKVHEIPSAPKTVVIVGGEEEGVPPYLRKVSDLAVKLPMNAAANSYNASVALSLALYELARQQGFPADLENDSESGTVEATDSDVEKLERELLDF